MLYEAEVASLDAQLRVAKRRAYRYGDRLRAVIQRNRKVQGSVVEIRRELDRLWWQVVNLHDKAERAHWANNHTGRRECYNEEDLVNQVIDDLSDVLMGLLDKAANLKERREALSQCLSAAERQVVRLMQRREETLRDRDRLVAQLARVPERYIRSGNFKVNQSSRYYQYDVYYGGVGKPDGPGHAHAAVSLEGEYLGTRHVGERRWTPRTQPARPGHWLTPAQRSRAKIPTAA